VTGRVELIFIFLLSPDDTAAMPPALSFEKDHFPPSCSRA
jgi:hypothetical protein